jgi:hypothetical protein
MGIRASHLVRLPEEGTLKQAGSYVERMVTEQYPKGQLAFALSDPLP